jgi:signal transduction histidine kinase
MTVNMATVPPNESERLAALNRYQILDTPPDGAFDRIASIAAAIFDVPIALVSLVDRDRIWFKAGHGLGIPQVDRDPGLCASVILKDDAYVVNDARFDPRTLGNPLVAGELGLRFYAAAPLHTQDGHNLGTLCVMDFQPRQITQGQIRILEDLAATVVNEMELRLAAREVVQAGQRLELLNELMHIATSTLDRGEAFSRIEEQMKQLMDYDRFSFALRPPGLDYLEMHAVAPESQKTFSQGAPPSLDTPMGEAILTGRPFIRRSPKDFTYPIEFEMHQAGGYNSAMFVPLKSKGRVVGSLNLGSNREDNFSEKELEIAQRIAEHMSVVVENAVLYEESRQSEEALRRLNKQLEEANRHKSEFLANLSHELRTPLNAILGASELLGDELFGTLNGKQAEYIVDIHDAGEHLLSLINDVLDLSKVEAGKLELEPSFIRLHPLMESSATIVRERAASKSLKFHLVPPAEDIVFYADERKVKQIIYNLLSNAVKFTPEGGRVVFNAHQDGDEVVFVVEDTGPGVAKEWKERVFEDFFQAPGNQEGTGLGLAVSKRLVELHGGRIWLESESSQGSLFLFTIPIREEAVFGSDRGVPQ